MAILSREDYLARIQGIIGEDTSDEAMSFIEDMTDTYNHNSDNNGENWKSRYEENDRNWRERYKARFFSGGEDTPLCVKEEQKNDVLDDGKTITFNDLFREREG